MENDLGTIIAVTSAVEGGARILADALETDEGKRVRKIFLKKLREAGAYKTATLVMEAEKVCQAIARTAKELEEQKP